MSFSKRPDSDAVCYTKPLDSLKRWNDHFFWVDSFACLASFSWHTDKNVSRDPFSKLTEFRVDDYAVLVAHSEFFELVFDYLFTFAEMDLFASIQVVNPTKVKVGERKHAEGEARLLDSTIGRVVPLLLVALARADSELEASVDKMFDEGGSADQEDSAAGGGQETETEIVTRVRFVADENVVTKKPKRPRKKRQVVTDASGSSHHPKKLKWDHETSSGAATGGKSPSVLKEVVRQAACLEYSSHHSSTNAFGVEADSVIRFVVAPPVMTEAVVTSHAVNVPPVPETGTKNVLNDSLLDDYDVSCEFVDHLAPPALFSQICEMDYHHLFTEFNVGTARQACLNAEVRMRTEYCLSERRRLESECEKQADLLKARDAEVESLKGQLLLKETKAAEAAHLRAQVSAAEATKKIHTNEIDALKQRNVALENEKESLDRKVAELQSSVSTKDLELKDLNVAMPSLRSLKDGLVDQIEEFQDVQMNIVNDKVANLDADLLEIALHLEERFYPHLLTTISGRRWLLTHGLKLAIVKCLNSQEYLLALGAAISRAIENGMQDGLSAGIDHGKAGRGIADVVTYNSAAEADYNSALQRLREVDFPLLVELKSHKDASVEDIMNLLRLEGPLVDAPGMNDLQPNIDQLMLHVHRSEDQVVLGETSLSFSLSVTHSIVERIRENVTAKRVPTTIATTTSLSTTFASASSVPPITIEDYEIVGTDGPEDARGNDQGNVASFPTVMAAPIISISSDSSEESVGSHAPRVILFEVILYLPVPDLPLVLPLDFIFDYLAPTSEYPLAPDIPIGRLYRTHHGGPCKALTVKKLVRPLSSHRLALRYTSHHLDHFTSGSLSHSSSDHSTSGHSISGHSLSGHTPLDTIDADTSHTTEICSSDHLLGLHD
ncbi:hypothetical protein Tco_0014154 [Tanacetum coccineum]